MNKQSGFTMIELVVVIVILSVLATIALPKFINFSNSARASSVKELEGAMRSANSNIYAKAVINNQTGATGSITIGNATISTVYGYAADAFELAKLMDLSSEFVGPPRSLSNDDDDDNDDDDNNGKGNAYAYGKYKKSSSVIQSDALASQDMQITHIDASDRSTCGVTLTAATATKTATYTTATSGC